MNVFVQKGFLTIPEAILRLADPSQSNREVAIKEARERLHQGLCGGSVKFVIQMQTGEHQVLPPDIWRSSNSLNWIVDGEVFIPDGTALRMPFGPYISGLPDDVNFLEMDGGTYATFLIVEDSLERFRGRVVGAEKIERLGDIKSNSRAIFRTEIEEKFQTWRKNFKTGQLPTHDQDVEHMKQFGVSRDRVRELRKKFPRRPRGRSKGDKIGG
jgi:hypothetical protein